MDLDRAEKIADQLANEKQVDITWRIAWDDDPYNLAVGQTDFNTWMVTFNRPLIKINSEDVFVETVLHEFAHTFVGPFVDHGPEWQRCARKLGATISVKDGMMPNGVVKLTPALLQRLESYNQLEKLVDMLNEYEKAHQLA